MTVFHHHGRAHFELADVRRMLIPMAIGVTLTTIGLTALGVYGDGSPGAEASTSEFFVICGIAVAAAVVVFALVIPFALRKDSAAVTALTLTILGALTIVVFWAGITLALAAGGILLGLAGRESAKGRGMASAACILGLLTAGAYVAIYVSDWMSTNGMI